MRISDWSSDVCSSDLLFFWFFIHPRGTRRVACAGSGGSPCPGGREPLFPPQDIPRLRGGRLCPDQGALHPWRAFRCPRPHGHGSACRFPWPLGLRLVALGRLPTGSFFLVRDVTADRQQHCLPVESYFNLLLI